MRHKRLQALLLAAAMLLCTGCQLARTDIDEAPGQDRLIGVFVTTEYLDLFDFEAYFQDNAENVLHGGPLDADSTQPYQGRLYAALQSRTLYGDDGETVETMDYVFEGVEGISYFAARFPATETESSYVGSSSDEAISNGHMNLSYTDETDSIDLEGTIFVATRSGLDLDLGTTCYFNPVYQTPDGRVYATSGSGITSDMEASGGVYSRTIEAENTVTENGETKTQRTSVKMSIASMDPPEEIVVLQMDQHSQGLSREAYRPGTLPAKLTLDAKAAYLIVETKSSVGVIRDLLEPEDTSLETFRCRDDGICVKTYTELVWNT